MKQDVGIGEANKNTDPVTKTLVLISAGWNKYLTKDQNYNPETSCVYTLQFYKSACYKKLTTSFRVSFKKELDFQGANLLI